MRRAIPWIIAGISLALIAANRRRDYDSDFQEIGNDQLPNPIESFFIKLNMPERDESNFDPRDYMARDQNLRAFLTMIAYAEGTDRLHGYATLFGGGRFDDFSDHPAELGWPGLRLPDHQCRAAGYGPGCVSTAAGRYQITRTTWRRLGGAAKYGDFSPQAQDAAAIDLLRENGALSLIEQGKFTDAVQKVKRVWASLPGAGYAQPERDLATLMQVYANAGGNFA